MLMSDAWILRQCDEHNMISPYEDSLHSDGVISYGLGSYGYDIRLDNVLMVPRLADYGYSGDGRLTTIDPMRHDMALDTLYETVEIHASGYTMAPGTHVLGSSLEYIQVPNDVLVVPQGKSTYARCGIVINMTPFEPGWKGKPTINIINPGPYSVLLRPYMGIAQLIFLRSDERTLRTYADRLGKYQDARQITGGKVQYGT